jgi:hypothetical protein
LAALRSHTAAELEVEQRHAVVLSYQLGKCGELEEKLGPRGYGEFLSAMEQRAKGLLLARGALWMPGGTGEAFQAVFGLPLALENLEEQAQITAELLDAALEDAASERKLEALWHISLVDGNLAAQVQHGVYQVYGALLAQGRHMAASGLAEPVEGQAEEKVSLPAISKNAAVSAQEALRPAELPQRLPEPAPVVQAVFKASILPAQKVKVTLLEPESVPSAPEQKEAEPSPVPAPPKATVSAKKPSGNKSKGKKKKR